jgi:hypothetical protein
MAFWRRLHERLAGLADRIDAAMQGRLMDAIHARVPVVTIEERRALAIEEAKANERLNVAVRDYCTEVADGYEKLFLPRIAESRAGAADAAARANAARERIARLERGET